MTAWWSNCDGPAASDDIRQFRLAAANLYVYNPASRWRGTFEGKVR
jgi:hypothetical protein